MNLHYLLKQQSKHACPVNTRATNREAVQAHWTNANIKKGQLGLFSEFGRKDLHCFHIALVKCEIKISDYIPGRGCRIVGGGKTPNWSVGVSVPLWADIIPCDSRKTGAAAVGVSGAWAS